jgi:hypothetical protein
MTASYKEPSKEALGRRIDRRNATPLHMCLVMCSREKASGPTVAEQLYVSERFSSDRHAAVSAGYDWMIVSGRYGLLEPQQVVTPYDVNLDRATRLRQMAWTFRVTIQLLMRIGLLRRCRIAISAQGVYRQSLALALRFLRFRLLPTPDPSLSARFEHWMRD